MGEPQASVSYRTGPLTDSDYEEAIEALQNAKRQQAEARYGCSVCGGTGCQASSCHHNPLVLARRQDDA